MLTNFLEHTRLPEAAIRSTLAGLDGDSPADSAASPSKAENFLKTLQQGSGDNAEEPLALSDADQAIELLRFERYIDNRISNDSRRGVKAAVRKTYYLLRPLFPVAFRKHLQRIALRGWDSRTFPAWPVDVTVEKLTESIWQRLLAREGVARLPFIWFWPDGQSSACIMTHDVEAQSGRDFCATMMQMEKRYGITSAFEVVPEERYTVPDHFLDEIRAGGSEVCIHGLNHDGHLFSSREIFLERAKKINDYADKWGALGFRSPVLYRNLEWFQELKFRYDMSVPNVGHLDPQPGGCCTVMPYFIGDLLELPLTTTQDYSLFHILRQRSLDLWMKQIEIIRERHGLISFIIHPDYTSEAWSSELYEALLQRLAELRSQHRIWVALPREVNEWWRARREMRLIQKDGTWEISGPQSERACLAYASLSREGRVVYSVEQSGQVSGV